MSALKRILVVEPGLVIANHWIPNPIGVLRSMEHCEHRLHSWGDGQTLYRGRCSRVCHHGVMIRTSNFPEAAALKLSATGEGQE